MVTLPDGFVADLSRREIRLQQQFVVGNIWANLCKTRCGPEMCECPCETALAMREQGDDVWIRRQ